jgi:3-deoxy-D-manno-octulosonic-acid transferase
VLAASTHPGEDLPIAEAFRAASAGRPEALLILVPRHPQRAEAIAAELTAAGFAVTRRSLAEAPPRSGVYLADTLGEMGVFLRLADAVVMGGSFVAGVGGHNPLEAARVGAAVVTGPHAANTQEVFDEMLAEAAAIQARDAAALARHIAGLLAHPHIARRIGASAQDYARRQNATLAAALPLIEALVAP